MGKRLETILDEKLDPLMYEFLEHMPGGCFACKLDNNISMLYANKLFLRIFECENYEDLEELSKGFFENLIHENDKKNVLKNINSPVGHKSGEIEFSVICKHGVVKRIKLWWLVLDTNYISNMLTGFIEDVTENYLKNKLDEKEHNEILKVVTDIYYIVYLVDMEHGKIKCLKSPKEISDFVSQFNTFEEIFAHIVKKMMKPAYHEIMNECLDYRKWSEKFRNRNLISGEYEGIYTGWCRMNIIAATRDEYGDVTNILVVVQDINEEKNKELEQQKVLADALVAAQHSSRAKTTFLNNVSHDIRTPMNAIIGFTALASSHIDDKNLVADYLEKIKISSNHLLSLVNDVLDMSRIESGKMKIEEEESNLFEILNDLKTIVQTDINNKKLDFYIDTIDVANANIVCDKLRLKQVLLNILSNSIKFTEDGGLVSLKVLEKKSPKICHSIYVFKIKDTGVGMSDAFKEHLFEPFERENTSFVAGIKGTGLGLAITKNIIDMMNGNIVVQSEQGKGSEFTITFDFKLPNSICNPITCKKEINNKKYLDSIKESLKGKKILLAEDNELNMEIAKTILEEKGFVVDIAENGQIAVDKIKAANPDDFDLILMDVRMPVLDGYEATRKIRELKDNPLRSIPIVAMTANAFDEDKLDAVQAGMDAHISKPIDIDDFLETLAEVLSEHK